MINQLIYNIRGTGIFNLLISYARVVLISMEDSNSQNERGTSQNFLTLLVCSFCTIGFRNRSIDLNSKTILPFAA